MSTHPDGEGAHAPVAGIEVHVFASGGGWSGAVVTGADGRWLVPDLPAARYVVVALVPAEYRIASGADLWFGGSHWVVALGPVDLAGHDLDLADLVLMPR